MASKLVQYPDAGCVVEFLQGNAAQIAWVMEEQNGKLRLLLPNRREMSLSANRILPWAGPRYDTGKSREDSVGLLLAHKQRREEIAAEVSPVDLWEMAQGEVDKASAQWLAELVQAEPDVDAVAACGQALLACKTHFRFQPPEFEIFPADMVAARHQTEEANREREALVGGGAEWFRVLWEARLAHKPAATEADVERLAPPEPVRSRLAALLRHRIVDPETQNDENLWKQVSKSLPDDPHLPLLLAISWGLVPEHFNYWLERADYEAGDAWSRPFNDDMARVLADTDARAVEPLAESFLSIDSASTHDIDDAFHIEARPEGGWRVTVALACPALTWPFGEPLDKAVARRATSIYLPEGDYHMMPESMGTGAYSLHAGQARPGLLLRCEVDADGTLISGVPEAAWLSLTANLTYPDCESVLLGVLPDSITSKTDNAATPYAEDLAMGYTMAEARLRKRVEQGAVVIERPDVEFYLEGEGAETRVLLKEASSSPRAQLLVAEMMILANAALAEWAVTHGVPLLFRTQDVAVPREFAGVWTSAPDIARVVRALAPASLETSPRPHAGMGLAAYSPVTSPLRRYVDFLNEAQVLSVLTHGEPRWSLDELNALLSTLGLRLDAAGQVQRFRPRYWRYLYIQQQAKANGEACCWDAVVAEENDAWVSISLPREQLMVRGKRQLFGEKVFPGQELKVRLGKVNPLRGEVSILEVREA